MGGRPPDGVESEVCIHSSRFLVSLNENEANGPVWGEWGPPWLSPFEAWHWAGLGIAINNATDIGAIVVEFSVSGVNLSGEGEEPRTLDDSMPKRQNALRENGRLRVEVRPVRRSAKVKAVSLCCVSLDINECAIDNGGCSETEGCANTVGSFECNPVGKFVFFNFRHIDIV